MPDWLSRWLGRARNTEGLISFADYVWSGVRALLGFAGGTLMSVLASRLEWFWQTFGWAGVVGVGIIFWFLITLGLYLLSARSNRRSQTKETSVEDAALYASTNRSIDAPGTAPDRRSYYDLMTFITQHLLPTCDALIDLQKTLVETASPNEMVKEFAVTGLLFGSRSDAREFWRNYHTLEDRINQSEPDLEFNDMIRCVRAMELRGYKEMRTATASLYEQMADIERDDASISKAVQNWVSRHNGLVEKYEAIRHDPRFSGQNTDGGSLFWPRKRNGFGEPILAQEDPLSQLAIPDYSGRKALQ